MSNLIQVIKYEGDNKTFVWKHECEDFNNLTQLIVHESQEAIFISNGTVLDIFSKPGRYTLNTESIPLLSKHISKLTNDINPFHSEVYFVNKTIQMAIKWGVGGIRYNEPNYNFPLEIGMSGEMFLKVENSKKLLLKIMGTETILDQTHLVELFRGIISNKIKSIFTQKVKNEKINIFEINEILDDLSKSFLEKLQPIFEDYGLSLENFIVLNIAEPTNDEIFNRFKKLNYRQYEEIAEAQLRQKVNIIDEETEAKKIQIKSEAIAKKREIEGYTYQQEKGFEVANNVAKNEGIGNFSGIGVGMGTIMSVGNTVGGIVNNAMDMTKIKKYCKKCNTEVPQTANFCFYCGSKIEGEQNENK